MVFVILREGMKILLEYLYSRFFRLALWLRYRIKVEGLDELEETTFSRPGGILFLASHPAEVDPAILLYILFKKFKPHPVAIDYLFQNRLIRYFLKLVGSFPVPHFEHGTNSFKRRNMEITYERILNALRNGENILLYPSGGLKRQAETVIGGASGTQNILQNCKEANVVLINTRGLWGSSFSRAITGTSPRVLDIAKERSVDLLKNLIFFMPKRHITIKIEVPKDFPYEGSRLEVNKYLENWFNKEGPEPLYLVPYQFWNKKVLDAKVNQNSLEKIDLSGVSEEIKKQVKDEIATLSLKSFNEITEKQYLSKDLGLDSLDQAQLLLFLRDNFGVDAHVTDLNKVEDAIALAARIKKGKATNDIVEKKPNKKWFKEQGRPHPSLPIGTTLIDSFLLMCDRMDGYLAGADLFLGEISYKKMKFVVLLLAEKIKKMPTDKIGIMLPASLSVNIVILATLLAKKIPVMINWTLGERNLASIKEETNLTAVISSWNFLDRLENVEFDGLDEKILLLEDLFASIPFRHYLKPFFYTHQKAKTLLKKYDLVNATEEETAVILFTSGTESFPKGVPLNHKNILENLKDGFQRISVTGKDILLGALPPFHSFGFSVTGLFPFVVGMRGVFYPNPTDGKKIASIVEKWKVTIICMVPTFLKNLARAATENQLKSVRLIVTGAEKTPEDLFKALGKLNRNAILSEGYGITECSPILTLNPLNKGRKGVGTPLSSVELMVVDPETKTIFPRNKEGLVLARGPNIFKGYLSPKLASPFLDIEGKTWYNTGDLGFLDEENYLTLSGRLKRFVKVGGEMISLGAIEEILLQELPKKIKIHENDAPVLAVVAKESDGKKGEIHLFTTFAMNAEEINSILRSKGMSNLIKVTDVHELNFIPLLGSGKIDYKQLASKI